MALQQQQAECVVCGNAAFDLLDGLYFCSECGTQSQDVREEVTETTTEAGDSVGFRRLIRSSTKKKEKQDGEGESPSIKGEGGSLSQLEIFQLILQKQCDAMVSLGVDPSIKEAVKLLWFHYLKYYGYAFVDSQADKNTPDCRSQQQHPSPHTPNTNRKKERSKTTPLISSSKMKTPQEILTGDEDGATPKKRGRGRPRKAISELLSKSGRRRRRDELTQSGQCEADEITSSARRNSGAASGRKRHREGNGERSNSRAKRIKVEEKEEDREEIFDEFPNDEHLFASLDTDGTDSASEEGGGVSGSDSDGELQGIELYLKRRRETQLVTGNPMLSYFSLKYTVCLCYLGLLYINQNVLLSDLVRWTLLNKVPYHNFASIFPRSITSSTNIQAYMAIVPLTSDRVYYLARALHSHLKLPPIPSLDPGPICHTIIDRLCLSPCFHSLLDKTLLCVHRPSFEESFRRIDLRFDGECLALVLFLVRLIYKLDDVYEFELSSHMTTQTAASDPLTPLAVPEDRPGPSASGLASSTKQPTTTGLSLAAATAMTSSTGMTGDQSRETSECSLYPWEDWVVLYLRHMRQLFDKEVPTNERELEYVTNYQKYVDFCRVEVFQATRPTPQNWFRRSVYNPEYYAKLSEIFKRYHTKVEQNAQVSIKFEDNCSSSGFSDEDAPGVSGTNEGEQLPPFTPRRISLQCMLSDPRAPWKNYRPLRGPQSFQGLRHSHLAGIDLSHSMSFLINAGTQLIDIRPEEVYEQILRVESSFVNTVLKELKKLDGFIASCRQ